MDIFNQLKASNLKINILEMHQINLVIIIYEDAKEKRNGLETFLQPTNSADDVR